MLFTRCLRLPPRALMPDDIHLFTRRHYACRYSRRFAFTPMPPRALRLSAARRDATPSR